MINILVRLVIVREGLKEKSGKEGKLSLFYLSTRDRFYTFREPTGSRVLTAAALRGLDLFPGRLSPSDAVDGSVGDCVYERLPT